MEPYGRFAIGILELVAALLLVYPPTTKYGAILGTVLMSGVILIHVIKLGIALNGSYDLFLMGVITFVCCLSLTYLSFYALQNKI